MFEMVKAIHEALHIESTWGFVLIVAAAFALMSGGVAWVVDKVYKNSIKESSPIGTSPKTTESSSPDPGTPKTGNSVGVGVSKARDATTIPAADPSAHPQSITKQPHLSISEPDSQSLIRRHAKRDWLWCISCKQFRRPPGQSNRDQGIHPLSPCLRRNARRSSWFMAERGA